MAKKSFYIIRRKDRLTNKKPTFYVRFRDTDGTLLPWRSSGETSKTRAELWAQAQLGKSLHRKENITLEAFAKGFWAPGGPFVQKRRDRGFTLSAGYLEIADGYTRNHIIPKWGSSRLRDLTPGRIDRWIVRLRKDGPLAPATVNKLLQTLRTILGHAVSEGYLQENPAAFVKPVKVEQGKRGILTPEEVMRLLGTSEIWPDFRHYVINLLALTTGARLGEIRGLLIENVKSDHIQIRHSWEEGHGLKEPKYNSIRDVPISERVSGALAAVIRDTDPKSIVFYGNVDKNQPMTKSVIQKHLYAAMRSIGITEEERRERGLCFHSHRHFLNTWLRSHGVPGSKVRQIAGHRSQKMSDLYTHYRASDFVEVVTIQGELLGENV